MGLSENIQVPSSIISDDADLEADWCLQVRCRGLVETVANGIYWWRNNEWHVTPSLFLVILTSRILPKSLPHTMTVIRNAQMEFDISAQLCWILSTMKHTESGKALLAGKNHIVHSSNQVNNWYDLAQSQLYKSFWLGLFILLPI